MQSKRHRCPPLKIGITGGIGSGKTTVCKIFEAVGIPVYYSDQRAKELMVKNEKLRNSIVAAFGKESYQTNGSLNRAYLASIVFQDKSMLEKLNGIIHPAVFEDADRWHEVQWGQPYTLREAALLVETGSYKWLDKLIAVAAPEELRMERVIGRDGVGEEEVKARMSKQLPQKDKIAKADFIITNDGEHLLVPQVMDIHRSLLNQWERS